MIRTIAAVTLIATLAIHARSEPKFDDALETDGAVKTATRTDAVDLTDFDPLEAKPAGVIKPRNHKPAAPKKPKLPPEGSKVVDRLCKIKTDPSGWVLAVFPAEGDRQAIRPRWALPNQALEALEKLQIKNPGMMFRISGEMTVYRDNSFMLIRRIAIVEPTTPIDPPAKASGSEGIEIVTPVATTQPKPDAGEKKTTGEKPAPTAAPSSSDLIKSMLAEKNPTPVILPRIKKKIPAAKVKSVAPGAKGDIIQPATARLVVDRLMTIRKTNVASWREATFEADNTLREPPVTLLPSQLLQFAEAQPATRRLRVTGEITNYKGKRYMLLRKVVVERTMNRL
jgi:hypothetical protein